MPAYAETRYARTTGVIAPQDGAQGAPSPSIPAGPVIPAKAGTYWADPHAPPNAVILA